MFEQESRSFTTSGTASLSRKALCDPHPHLYLRPLKRVRCFLAFLFLGMSRGQRLPFCLYCCFPPSSAQLGTVLSFLFSLRRSSPSSSALGGRAPLYIVLLTLPTHYHLSSIGIYLSLLRCQQRQKERERKRKRQKER